jgi:hypothetical protein
MFYAVSHFLYSTPYLFTNQAFWLKIDIDRKFLLKDTERQHQKSMKGAGEHERVKKHKRKKVALRLGAAPLCKANRLYDLRGHGLSQPRRK